MSDDKNTLEKAIDLCGLMIQHESVKGVAETQEALETLFFTLRGLQGDRLAARDTAEKRRGKLEPAISPIDFVGHEAKFVACLECGAKVKDLTAHLQKKHAMLWGEYKDKWEGFAKDKGFELLKISGALSAKRSDTAKAAGLGVTPKGAPVVEEPDPFDSPPTAEDLENDRINRTCMAACGYVRKVRGNADVPLSEVAAKLNQPASWIRYTIEDSPRCGYRITDEYDENGRLVQTWLGLS